MIREIRKNDYQQVLDIWYKASVKAHSFIKTSFWDEKKQDMEEMYLPNSETYVFESETGLVKGFISLHENKIEAIFVSPNYQGKGIGTSLLEKAKAQQESLILTVYKKNQPSIEFYKSQGFETVCEQLDEQTGEVELVMKY